MRFSFSRALTTFILALAFCGATVHAQTIIASIPDNARAKSYGSGWECNRGFLESGKGCAAIQVPPHGYLSALGSTWACERGYRRTGETCTAVVIPTNAFATESTY